MLSLTDSVPGYSIEYGRRYLKYHEGTTDFDGFVAYVFPIDEQELDRLDMQHHMFKLVNNGRLYLAPLQDPKRMLDIGTGSGIWPIEMGTNFPHLLDITHTSRSALLACNHVLTVRYLVAALFPNAVIIGTDLTSVKETEAPENVHFLLDDAAEDYWLWEPDYFDYIRLAHLTGAMPSFKELLRKSLEHLTPGGWLECHEMDPKPMCDDGTMPPENEEGGRSAFALHDWWRAQHRSGQFTDPPRQFRIAHRIERSMRESGFVDIQQRIKKVPTNPWPSDPEMKEIGSRSERNWLEALSGWSYKPLASLGWTRPEIEAFLVDVRKAIQNRDVHCYMNFHVVTGRKPFPDEKKAS
ncbi:Methyltransferase domain protein [Aspergillus parasiticus SU-1]|uniref:Methyltransferase domain protein n=1 Tax=Aspergillus parasiticus (strain ATCC 56775 / NRRL 5862 / SRRC 143 / SU-1) TaxID=1403190 RepID=A0A0F0IKW9_ASPPU|nr:Methyltransferase domain protein [Aspergillus parasiticus SU-1]